VGGGDNTVVDGLSLPELAPAYSAGTATKKVSPSPRLRFLM